MIKISDIKSREILDSRSNPTLETTVFLSNGINATASVPSGASKGKHEMLELRDLDMRRYLGQGVLKAIDNIQQKIKPNLIGKDICSQNEIDQIMIDLDGTKNKSNLGANSILSVSLAVSRAGAKTQKKSLYQYLNNFTSDNNINHYVTPIFNLINGGLHGNGKFCFQEFILIPNKTFPYSKALQIGVEIYQNIKKLLKIKNLGISLGDEGGFTPNLDTNNEVLDLMIEAIDKSKYILNKDVFIGLDLASTTFFQDNFYYYDKNAKTKEEDFITYLVKLQKKYQIYSFEDPLAEDSWSGWSQLTKRIGDKTLIIGDDLLVTNIERLKKAIISRACNAILVKVNQIGTLSETLDVIKTAKKANFKIIISHRSGETNDDYIADLAVGVSADYAKFGAPARGERVAKYNRLSKIYKDLI